MVTLKPPCSSWSPTDMIPLVFVLLVSFDVSLACPAGCRCHSQVVRCRDAGLTSLPVGLPKDVRQLDLSENAFTRFVSGAFGHLTELRQLILSDNRLTEVPVFDAKSSRLERLTLAGNLITVPSGSAIAALRELRRLDLRNNNITDLNRSSFPRNCSVDTLVLSENQISAVSPSWLSLFPKLQYLRLNKNSVRSLQKFPHLRALEILDLSNNQIGQVQSLTFENLPALTVIKLQKNGLTELKDGSFYVSESQLQEIHLEHNSLTEINEGEFFGLQLVKKMYISHNKISSISSLQPFFHCKSLEILDLSENELPIVESSWFSTLGKLNTLRLDHNRISTIEPNSFIQCSSLTELVMDYNYLSWPTYGKDGLFKGLTSLRMLKLKRNMITSVKGAGFEDLGSLQFLDLSLNPVSTLDENTFTIFTSLQRLVLNSTTLYCDCHMAWFPKWIREKNMTKTAGGFCKANSWYILRVPNATFSCANHPWIVENPQHVVANKGHNVTLRCKAESQSLNVIEFLWMKEDELLVKLEDVIITNSSGMSHVKLLNVNFEDAGRYYCIADNGFARKHSTVAEVKVYEYPTFTVRPGDSVVFEGSDVNIDCRARGKPTPVVGIVSASGDGFVAAIDGRIDIHPILGTTIKNASKRDTGLYYCNATSDAGTAITEFVITVLPPLPVEERGFVSVTGVVGQSLVMACNITGLNVLGHVTWYKGKQQVKDSDRIRQTKFGEWLVFAMLRPDDMGRYSCQAPTEKTVVQIEYNLRIKYNLSLSSNLSCNNTVVNLGDDDVTWIVVAVICGFVLACAWWVIGIFVWKFVRRSRQVKSKQCASNTSASTAVMMKPMRRSNGHSRPVVDESSVETSSGSGGMAASVVNTHQKKGSVYHNGVVGNPNGVLVSKGSYRPISGSNGTCALRQDHNTDTHTTDQHVMLDGVTAHGHSHSINCHSQMASAPCSAPKVAQLQSSNDSSQPLGSIADPDRCNISAKEPSSSYNSDSEVE